MSEILLLFSFFIPQQVSSCHLLCRVSVIREGCFLLWLSEALAVTVPGYLPGSQHTALHSQVCFFYLCGCQVEPHACWVSGTASILFVQFTQMISSLIKAILDFPVRIDLIPTVPDFFFFLWHLSLSCDTYLFLPHSVNP